MESEIISLRKFAERLQVGEKTIRDGIKTGKIVNGVKLIDGKPKIIYSIALEEAKAIGLGNKVLKYKTETQRHFKNDESKTKGKEFIDLNLGDGSLLPLAQALQAKENYNVKIKELEYKEMDGILVNKEAVHKQLFAFAQELRDAFQSLPNQVSADIAACGGNINKITNLLNDSIHTVLEKLSNTESKEIG